MKFVLLIHQGPTPTLPGSDRWKALPEEQRSRWPRGFRRRAWAVRSRFVRHSGTGDPLVIPTWDHQGFPTASRR